MNDNDKKDKKNNRKEINERFLNINVRRKKMLKNIIVDVYSR